MKKLILTSFTILCLLFTLLLIGYKLSVKASPSIIYVPTHYPTIQEAINHATSGDTISVYNGTYYEHIIIDKSITLLGEDRNLTIIDGGTTGTVIHVAANNVYISNLTIREGGKGLYDSGIFIDHSSSNTISHNTIANSSHGICISYSVTNTVFNNTVLDNKYGVSLYSSNNNEIYGNNASNNKYGIALYSSNNNKIHNNNASSSKISGIYLHSSNNNLISSNAASLNNYDGIRLDFSNNNEISGNTILNNDYGIYLHSSINNLVSCNTETNNYYGIYLHSSSDNNTIYHNNFNNTDQVWSDSVNDWGKNSEGNYWSDYTGQDTNRDGIGDTPHVIDEKNQDNHPLMGKFSAFGITWKDKTYHITTICNSTISGLRFEVGKETGNKIMSFNAAGKDGTASFCRIMISAALMNYSYIVLIDGEEMPRTILDVSNKTHVHLYFTYAQGDHNITIISSKLLYLYNELLGRHIKLQTDFDNLNLTYSEILDSYNTLLNSYSQLLRSYSTLNESYQQHLLDYEELQENNTSLLSEHAQNIRNLSYVFVVTITFFIIVAFYLSAYAHRKDFRTS